MNISNYEKLNINIQSLIFEKKPFNEIDKALNDNNLDINKILNDLFFINSLTNNEDNISNADIDLSNKNIDNVNLFHKVEIIKSIIFKLLKYNEYKILVTNYVINNKINIPIIKNPNTITFIINFFIDNFTDILDKNIKYKDYYNFDTKELFTVLKLYLKVFLLNINTGVHNLSVKGIFKIKDKLLKYKDNNLNIENSLNNFDLKEFIFYIEENRGNNSVYLVRYVDFLLKFSYRLHSKKNNCEEELSFIMNKLTGIFNNFFELDILTQLSMIDILENYLSLFNLLSSIINIIDFFNNINNNTSILESERLTRKYNYFLSKLYASLSINYNNGTFINNNNYIFDNKLLKNMLCVSLQVFEETEDYNFMIAVFINTFHNINIYNFLMNKENNVNYNFLENILYFIINSYNKHDYKIKILVLELLTQIFSNSNFFKNNKDIDNQTYLNFKSFIFDLFKCYNNKINDNNTNITCFIQNIYSDFQTHDFEEYELIFLNCLESMFSINELLYPMLCNFELVLYLLNKRDKEKSICEKKFSIIKQISENKLFKEKAHEEVVNQFNDYLKSGIF